MKYVSKFSVQYFELKKMKTKQRVFFKFFSLTYEHLDRNRYYLFYFIRTIEQSI